MSTETISGGCQCGEIRYRVDGGLEDPHICHCRMCQKAAGNYFLPLAFAPGDRFRLTRGEPRWFHSSAPVRRGFCGACGTPLFFDTVGSEGMAVTLGSLDAPELFVPQSQDGVESRLSFHHELADLHEKISNRDDLPGGLQSIVQSNNQHPDHDTEFTPETSGDNHNGAPEEGQDK